MKREGNMKSQFYDDEQERESTRKKEEEEKIDRQTHRHGWLVKCSSLYFKVDRQTIS